MIKMKKEVEGTESPQDKTVYYILNTPQIELEGRTSLFIVTVTTDDVRRKIRLATATGDPSIEITFDDDDLTLEKTQELLVLHKELLNLAMILRDKQFLATDNRIKTEIQIKNITENYGGFGRILLQIIRASYNLYRTLNSEKPLSLDEFDLLIKGQIVDMLVLRRAIAEIAKQKETYEGLSKEQSTTELDQLIKVMGQAVHILNALAQSFQNEIGANIRSMESFK